MSNATHSHPIPQKITAIRYDLHECTLIDLLCFLFQLLKRYIADCVFYLMGVLLRRFLIDTSGDQLLHEKFVAFTNLFSNRPSYIGQTETAVFIYDQKSASPQILYRMADTCF